MEQRLAFDGEISTRTPHAGSDTLSRTETGHDKAISTRTPHAGSDLAPLVDGFRDLISTRTPHAGSDVNFPCVGVCGLSISTRTPHAGSDRNIMCKFTASINI